MRTHQAYFARGIRENNAAIRRLLVQNDENAEALGTFGLKTKKCEIGALKTLREEMQDYAFRVYRLLDGQAARTCRVLGICQGTLRRYLRERQKRIECEE
jgi:hypothetical protein